MMMAVAFVAGLSMLGQVPDKVLLLEDGFGSLPTGSLFDVLGAQAEYHYFPQCAPKGGWAVSSYISSAEWQRAWRIGRDGQGPFLLQTCENTSQKHTHPIVVAGDPMWADYEVAVRFTPQSETGRCGILFRYQNDRCYYFLGIEEQQAILKFVQHEVDFHVPLEKTLASSALSWKPGEKMEAVALVNGSKIVGRVNTVTIDAEDAAYSSGRIGLLADMPAIFRSVQVMATADEKQRCEVQRKTNTVAEAAREAANPKPVVWKKIETNGFGVGRNLRFGDLDGDGQVDVVFGQVLHHGPKDTNSELSCLTAMTFDGKKLWQLGEPDPWKSYLTNDVAFQVHDIDGDGRNEVIYCRDFELVIAEGATGQTKLKVATPQTPAGNKGPQNRFDHVLGDSLFFCDLRGQGRLGDMVFKDRYQYFWVYNEQLALQWKGECNTGHYPCASDIDDDGKDELMIGYSLYDDDGTQLWSLDKVLKDHADGNAVVRLQEGQRPVVVCTASDEGMVILDTRGNILKHHRLGHVQNPAIADFRPDLPGLEIVSVNFWGNQGIIHFCDSDGNVYYSFEPFQFGSMCLPTNWAGKPPEYIMLCANVELGGLFDGWGRRVVRLPADGHPEMCYAVLDITGDCRDEIIVWDPYELWVYTQSDNPTPGRLYKPRRNPLYNYSNYQATVSLPGWSE